MDHDGKAEVLVGAESADHDGQAMLYSSTCYRPETYCSLNPNSAGAGAKIGYFGLLSITANDFHLTVEDAPPGQFSLFLYGREENDLPFGDGYLCAGGGIARMELPGLTDGSGAYTRQLDFLSMPASGPGHIEAASKQHFQFWFRDPNGPGGAGFNLSNGLRVQFCL